MNEASDFNGSKLLLFIGPALVVLRRDDKPTIPWPNALDFPGGARDPGETPEVCILRETLEEVGLVVTASDLIWRRKCGRDVFFAAHFPSGYERHIVFGNEGQGWCLMPPADYIAHPDRIPRFAQIARDYLAVEFGRRGTGGC